MDLTYESEDRRPFSLAWTICTQYLHRGMNKVKDPMHGFARVQGCADMQGV